MQQLTVGYSWDDVEALAAHQRIHILNGLIFTFTDEPELVAVPDTHHPRYAPNYGNTQSAAWNDPHDHLEAAQQNDPAARKRYAEEAAGLLIEAQGWLADPHNRYKPGAPNFLRYGTNQQGEWRNNYGILVRADDESYGWNAPNGGFYVLIARAGQIVAIVREYLERMRAN